MARYHESWKPDVKSMFAPLPLEYMEQKIQGVQGEHDYYQSLLNSSYDEKYSTELFPGDVVNQRKQDYQNDMSQIQDSLQGTFDFSNVAQQIQQVQNKYNISGGTGANLTSSNSNGVGSTRSTSGTNTSQTSAASNTGGFQWGSDQQLNAQNYDVLAQARDDYSKQNGTNSPAYEYWYVDKKNQQELQRVIDDPNHRPSAMSYDVIEQFDNQKFNNFLIAEADNWKADKNTSQIFSGDYTMLASHEYVGYDRLYGNEQAGTLGYILNNDEWNQDKDILFAYGADHGTLDVTGLYSQSLIRNADNDTKRKYMTDYGDDWYDQYVKDMNNGKIQYDIDALNLQQQNQVAQSQYGKNFDALTPEQQKQLNRQIQYTGANQQYKFNAADDVATYVAEKGHFDKYDKKSLQQSVDSKYTNAKGLIDYQHMVDNPITTNDIAPVTAPNQNKQQQQQAVTGLFTAVGTTQAQATNANTNLDQTMAQSNATLFGGDNNGSMNAPGAALMGGGVALSQSSNQQAMFNTLVDAGAINYTPEGTIEFKNIDDIDYWRGITNNNQLTTQDLQSVAVGLNNSYTIAINANRMAIETQATKDILLDGWLQTDDGIKWTNDTYNSLSTNANGKKVAVIDGKEVVVNGVDDLLQRVNDFNKTQNHPNTGFWNTMGDVIHSGNDQTNKKYDTSLQLPMSDITDYATDQGVYNSIMNTIDWTGTPQARQYLTGLESSLQNTNTFNELFDYNGQKLTDGFTKVNVDEPYTISNVHISGSTRMGGKKVAVMTYMANGVDSDGKTTKEPMTQYVDISDDSNTYGLNISSNLLETAYRSLNNLDAGQTALSTTTDNQIITNFTYVGQNSPRTNYNNIIDGGIDKNAIWMKNAKDGDVTPSYYTTNTGLDVVYMKKTGSDGVAYQVQYMKDANGTIYQSDNSVPLVYTTNDIFPQIGQIDWSINSNKNVFNKGSRWQKDVTLYPGYSAQNTNYTY